MNRFFNHLLIAFLKLLSRLPLRVLYAFSNLLYIIVYKLLKYRLKVVRTNLNNSFPERSQSDLVQIEKNYYRYLCDLIVETLKLYTANPKTLQRCMSYSTVEVLDQLVRENRSGIVVMGHSGNWEWVCQSAPFFMRNRVVVAYKPLSNPYFEKLMFETRTRYGVEMVPMAQIGRYLLNQKTPYLLILLSDQSPTDSKSSYWTRFLNQDTAVMRGAEKLAEKFNLQVLYNPVRRIKRGQYVCSPYAITSQNTSYKPDEITELHTRILEEEIIKQPEIWLWSHKRWKLKR